LTPKITTIRVGQRRDDRRWWWTISNGTTSAAYINGLADDEVAAWTQATARVLEDRTTLVQRGLSS
jgi:hypothetical protein